MVQTPVLKLKKKLPVLRANEGSEIEPLDLKNFLSIPPALHTTPLTITPKTALPAGLVCTEDGILGGTPVVGTAKPTPYSIVFMIAMTDQPPLTLSTSLFIYARLSSDVVRDYNDEAVRKYKLQQAIRAVYNQVLPADFPKAPNLLDNKGQRLAQGQNFDQGLVHPILAQAVQFSSAHSSENPNPSENNQPDIQNRLELVQRPENAPRFNPTPITPH